MITSSNLKLIPKLNFLISIILFLSIPLSKANVIKENEIQSGDPITQQGTLQLNQSKEFMSLVETDIINDTDDKTVQNPPQGTTPLSVDNHSTDTPKNPAKNRRRSTCNKKDVGKNIKRRNNKSKLKLRDIQQPTEASGLGDNLNDLIRGVQIFNDPKVTQDINAFKTLLDAFEQMKKARSQQEDESEDRLNPRNAGNRTPVKVQHIPPSNYSFSGPKVNVNANKNFSMDYEDYVPPQYVDSTTSEEDGDQADYRPVEASAPIKRSIRRLIVRDSGSSPPKASTSKPSSPKPSTKASTAETHSKAPPAKAVPATSRTETSAVIRIVRNSTADHHNSMQDLWKEYQIAIVTVPAVFLVLLLIIIIFLITKTAKGYQSVPSSSYESDTEAGTVRVDDVSKNCPPQQEYLPYMEHEPKRYGVSESERIIKTLGGYTLIRTKESIEDLLNYVSKRVTPPSSAKSVGTQVGNGPFHQQPSLDLPASISQPPITESKVKDDGEEDDDDDLVAVDDVDKKVTETRVPSPPKPEPKKTTGCSPCCSPNRSDPASTISHHPKKPIKRRRKPRKSPSFFRGCLSGPTDESADTDGDSHCPPSNDECIQSVVTQGASLLKTEHPCKGTRNEMQEVLKTDVKRIDDMLTDGNWERAYYNKGGNIRFSDGNLEASESPGPGSDRMVKCKKSPLPRIAPSEDGVFTMKYYLGSSADLSEKNPALQRPF